ncbi:polysaccharide deacetylase family protein [Kitasatospora sp. MAP5-34]|uniref:polysaccharide deacetylase family protein n=1 Tax=Kitasatospora sp. MAP5-34 TaxID=3035102 RepID=UPI002473F55B|nr:polysaccharide deacetylase family protein [Kitasatospora sp. MAP5-34]MDH6575131.1 peptidoglycan/xylan/chitin deacetylase (PgdA/CDA1 family) [Kitasatospora sp. MAP5-34]
MKAVPVFLYHSVSDDPPSWIAPWTVSPSVFRRQIAQIVDSGLTVVPLRRLVSAILGGTSLPPRAAVLTFDDGFADFYWTVAPLLSDHGLPATLYVTVGAMHPPGGRPSGSLFPPAQMLNWRQVSNLDTLGIEIGGHSQTHAQLDTVYGRRCHDEIAGCKRRLEDALGHEVTAFAYPHGYSSPSVRRKVRQAGWVSATAVQDRFSSAADNPVRISRLMLHNDTPPDLFEAWTRGRGARVAPLPERPHDKGYRAYRRLRAALGSPVGGPPEAPEYPPGARS